ncbi:MAG: carcinine hydrolase/isopenicillin-N N-acyltransferase family protein [Spirochaetes bacterium]|nr:carcinine hydrolase/isopenicillin-N N-acyltransferase family protein [Spirochaetota bacterium]
MCDTLYAGPAATGGERAWFAKNSDRHPDEPQALCIVPCRPTAPVVHVSGRTFGVPDRGFSFVLSKPSWMEGGEMGVNERGVAIGNEAVFSRFKARKDGVLGMDLLRAALAHAETAAEARDFLCSFVERESQGGNGAYKGSLVYSNSFIVASPGEGFVLETADRRWAWRSTRSIATISNAYSIADDHERLDACTLAELAQGDARATASGGSDPGCRGSWKAHVEDRFYLAFTKGELRRACTAATLRAAEPAVGFETVIAALRSHGKDARGPGRAGMAAPCLHEAGFPVKSSTTASMVVEYLPPGCPASAIVWFTGASYPCLSVFVPILLAGGTFLPLWTGYDHAEGSTAPYRLWETRRAIARGAGGAARSEDHPFAGMRDGVQARLLDAAREAASAAGDAAVIASARVAVDGAMRSWEAFLAR